MKRLDGKVALVTGASSGIGWEFAKILGSLGAEVIVVARNKEKLEKLRKEIESKSNTRVYIISLDLSGRNSPERLYLTVKKLGLKVDFLINNAGYGIHNSFMKIPWEEEKAMLDLLIMNLTYITKLFIKDMVKRNSGKILNVSSTGAFQPAPYYTTYAAAKSYVLSFSQALAYELRKTKVRVTTLCPGATYTGFQKTAGQQSNLFIRLTGMSAEKVARIGIRTMLKGKSLVVPGLFNALSARTLKLLPLRFSSAIAARVLGEK